MDSAERDTRSRNKPQTSTEHVLKVITDVVVALAVFAAETLGRVVSRD